MEKNAAKRDRIEESNESGRFCEEAEASPAKRLRKETNVDVVCEIMSKIDNEKLGFDLEETVWDIMKMLEEEMYPSLFCTDDIGANSNGFDEFECSGDKDRSFNAEFDYLVSASDEELGIPCSLSLYTVNNNDCSLNGELDYLFECFEMEDLEQQLLSSIWLGYGESVEQEGSDLFK